MFLNSVKFTLLSFVALLFFVGTADVGVGDVSSPTGRISSFDKDDTNDKRNAPLFSGDGKFLASLRFWEKNQSPPPKGTSQSKTAAARPTSQTADTPSSETASATEAPLPQHSATTEPEMSSRFEPRDGTLGDAPLPGRSNAAYDSGSGIMPIETPSGGSSYVFYSFDTRDWVESFPDRQAYDTTREGEQGATQKTSLRFAEPHPSPTLFDDTETGDWNGHATVLVPHIRREPRQTAAMPVVVPDAASMPPEKPVTERRASEKPAPEKSVVEKPLIDLTPSYQKRLPHVQTCGVVVVQANFPLTEIAAILDEIDQLQLDLNRYIGVPEPTEKIELCLFKDDDSYARFLREFFPRAPTDRRALYVKLGNKPGTLMVQKTKDFEIDLRHEMTHAIIHASIPVVPIWLDEGLAKYFEVPPKDRYRNNPYMSRIRFDTKTGTVPSLDRLTRLENIDDMATKEYRDSWAWTHFLIHRSPETHQLLAGYLQMLATWSPQEQENKESALGRLVSTQRRSSIPSLKLYLDDIMLNQREAFKEHFGSSGK